jgi:hypothetical protein
MVGSRVSCQADGGLLSTGLIKICVIVHVSGMVTHTVWRQVGSFAPGCHERDQPVIHQVQVPISAAFSKDQPLTIWAERRLVSSMTVRQPCQRQGSCPHFPAGKQRWVSAHHPRHYDQAWCSGWAPGKERIGRRAGWLLAPIAATGRWRLRPRSGSLACAGSIAPCRLAGL